jgi:hypothetical protein
VDPQLFLSRPTRAFLPHDGLLPQGAGRPLRGCATLPLSFRNELAHARKKGLGGMPGTGSWLRQLPHHRRILTMPPEPLKARFLVPSGRFLSGFLRGGIPSPGNRPPWPV